jgi:hypothetical protein
MKTVTFEIFKDVFTVQYRHDNKRLCWYSFEEIKNFAKEECERRKMDNEMSLKTYIDTIKK